MIRKRLAALACAAGLGLFCGCSSSNMACAPPREGFFSRLTSRLRPAKPIEGVPIEAGEFSGFEGPILMDRGPVFPPQQPPCASIPGGSHIAPQPRLVPEPQATVRPYIP